MSYRSFLCRRDAEKKRYERLMKLSSVKYSKSMDLFQFVKRQRFNTYAILSLLSGRQSNFMTRLSYPVLHESTDTASESDGIANVRWSKDGMKYLTSMQVSGNPVDSRALNIFRAMREVGFKERLLEDLRGELAKEPDDAQWGNGAM